MGFSTPSPTPAGLLALKGLTFEQLRSAVVGLELEPYRASQIADWVYRKQVGFEAMTNLPLAVREGLSAAFHLTPVAEAAHQVSLLDGTRKFLLRFADGESAETVLMPRSGHATVCVSSQVGCRFACKFCLTARRGLVRDLGADEIVQQVLHARPYAGDLGLNIVFMGMGEPLDNFDAVVQSIRVLSSPELGMIGARRITVSTTGLAAQIRALAALDLRVRLAVSLNASDDASRRMLMPVSARDSLAETLAAATEFATRTRHHVTLEYVLLAGVNDRMEDAARLRALGARPTPFKLNLIPFNPDPRLRYARPDAGAVEAFRTALNGSFRSVTVRWSQGLDIDAACGQLFGRRETPPPAAAVAAQ